MSDLPQSLRASPRLASALIARLIIAGITAKASLRPNEIERMSSAFEHEELKAATR